MFKVLGGDDRIQGLSKKVGHNDTFHIGNLHGECLFTPCHTSGHICYLIKQDGEPSAVFTGTNYNNYFLILKKFYNYLYTNNL